MDDLDSKMEILESIEAKERGLNNIASSQAPSKGRVLIGTVEKFFSKLSVVAIRLKGNLKVGDIIEMGNEEEAIRQRVYSMQIDRDDVIEASAGDSVGIKTKYPVAEGSSVYRMEQTA